MSRFSQALDRWVSRLTLAFAWLALPLLIAVTLFDVVSRQFHSIGSEALHELEADLFFALVMLSFGYTYLRDGHVRVDIFRERMRARSIAWIELVGCLAIAIPLGYLLVDYGGRLAWLSLVQGERSEALMGLPYRWVIKSAVPLGFLLLVLSSACVMIRNVLFLIGKEDAPAAKGDKGPALVSTVPERQVDAK